MPKSLITNSNSGMMPGMQALYRGIRSAEPCSTREILRSRAHGELAKKAKHHGRSAALLTVRERVLPQAGMSAGRRDSFH